MSEPIAVLALRRKRDQISGTIAHYERLIREAEHDLAHVNAALRLFEVTGEAADLPPYVDLNGLLRRGETTKICMDALAEEGPLDTRQLALRIIKAKGLSERDKVLAQSIALRVVQTLRMRARRNKSSASPRRKGFAYGGFLRGRGSQRNCRYRSRTAAPRMVNVLPHLHRGEQSRLSARFLATA